MPTRSNVYNLNLQGMELFVCHLLSLELNPICPELKELTNGANFMHGQRMRDCRRWGKLHRCFSSECAGGWVRAKYSWSMSGDDVWDMSDIAFFYISVFLCGDTYFLQHLYIGRFQPFTGLMHARWWFQDCHTVISAKKDIWWYLQVWANFCSLLFGILLHFLCAENLKFSPTKKPIWVSCDPWVVWMVEEYGLYQAAANRKSSGPSSVASPPQWHACQLPGRRTDLIFSSWDPWGDGFSRDISRHFLGYVEAYQLQDLSINCTVT